MRVGQIDRNADPALWLYRVPHHKTGKKVKWKKVILLGLPEQKLIAPYLEGKKPEQAVFSPRTAQAERYAEKRANRKTKITPSQIARAKERAAKPPRYSEFYNRFSYRQAIHHAIEKANRLLPDGQKIPHWSPYQLRHSASSAMEVEVGFDESQALLDHTSANTTARYNHRRLEKLKKLARNRRDPFVTEEQAEIHES